MIKLRFFLRVRLLLSQIPVLFSQTEHLTRQFPQKWAFYDTFPTKKMSILWCIFTQNEYSVAPPTPNIKWNKIDSVFTGNLPMPKVQGSYRLLLFPTFLKVLLLFSYSSKKSSYYSYFFIRKSKNVKKGGLKLHHSKHEI